MNPRTYAATVKRVLFQLLNDKRTIALIMAVPALLVTLLYFVYKDYPGGDVLFDRVAVQMIAILPMSAPRPAASLSSVVGAAEVSLPVGDVLDVAAEIARLGQEVTAIEKTVASSQARLDKPDFVARAPQEVVEKERARVAEGEAQITRLKENLESLSR